jgi:hypothetical protein
MSLPEAGEVAGAVACFTVGVASCPVEVNGTASANATISKLKYRNLMKPSPSESIERAG